MRLWLLIFIILYGCNTASQQKERTDITVFNTTYPSVLFFKNVRSPYYRSTMSKDESLISFNLKDRSEHHDRIILRPTLNLHPYEDRASVTLKINGEVRPDAGSPIEWHSGTNGQRGTIEINWGEEDHTRVAIEIYDRLINGAEFFLQSGEKKTGILQNRDDRESFRITLTDFLRLIEAV